MAIEGVEDEVQIVLEDNDIIQSVSNIQADGLLDFPIDQQIFFDLEIDPDAETATPTVSFETEDGDIEANSGEAIDLSGTNVLDAIQGNYTVNNQDSGVAVGLFSSNTGQPENSTFQAAFNDIEITATGDTSETVIYRINAGGIEIAANDGSIPWSADTTSNNSPFLLDPGSNQTASFPAVEPLANVPGSVPNGIFDTERWDQSGDSEMAWAFDVPEAGLYEVRLYLGNGFDGTSEPGERIFDVAIEDTIPENLNDIDLSEQFGNEAGGLISNTVSVTDGTLNLEFLHEVENPLINGIEIIQLGEDETSESPIVSIIGGPYVVNENESQVQISLLTDVTVPNDEIVNVTFEIVPGTATAEEDYIYQSDTATFDPQTGIYTDTVTIAGGSSDATFLTDIVSDTIAENDEVFSVNITDVSPNVEIGTDSASVTIQDSNFGGEETVLYRVNAGGSEIAATDESIPWSADTTSNNSSFLVDLGSNQTAAFPAVEPLTNVSPNVPDAIFDSERWDQSGNSEMEWAFDVPDAGLYEVRLYLGNGFDGTSEPGERIFDVAVEDSIPENLNDLDLSEQFGHEAGGLISNTVSVTDGTLNLEFLHGVENPLVNGIEIIQLTEEPVSPTESGAATLTVTSVNDDVQASNLGSNSFEIANIGNNKITQVDIDVTNALYPDTVFDPLDEGEDTVTKEPTDITGGTGVIAVSEDSYIGTGGTEGMEWSFDVPENGLYEVRLYMGNGSDGTDNPGERLFDVAIEGTVPDELSDIDLVSEFGHETGGIISSTANVTDGTINIEFIHNFENPLINGIEIVELNT